ncbi:MAG TPA: hypothetical protein VHQ21_20475, partial [Rhodanobacteraceae bacterium]|nr:hypothetical protein [Rhodanobacteraceae bacterium]
MSIIRRAVLAFALVAGLAPAFAQTPPPVPALPDAERRTSYSISSSNCACSVGFQLYGDSTDYGNWIEVFVNGVFVPSTSYTITSPTGALATIPRPITDAVLTFNTVQTGTVQIVGARRPRRTSQFQESQPVPTRNFNQTFSDIIATQRELWDKTNDITGRGVFAPPGETLALLPPAANRANQGACFDNSGNLVNCVSIASSTFIAGTGITFTGTNPTTISLTPAAIAGIRTKLSSPTTFFVGTAGIDQAGCGLTNAPGTAQCRTRSYLYNNVLAPNYDLGFQQVTVQLADGTYTDSLQAQGPLLIGQNGSTGLIFTGNCTTPSNVLIQPASASGYAYSADSGAGYRIQCQKLDQTSQRVGNTVPSGADIVVVTHGSKVYFGNPSLFGVRQDLIFGCNYLNFNAITVAFSGIFQFDNAFGNDVTSCQATTTGTVTNGSATISGVASTAGVVQNMGVIATNVPSDAYVLSFVANTSITFACIYTSPCQANGSPGSVTVTMTGGGQDFLDMGNGATGYFNTNGQPDFSIIDTLGGFPFYTSGYFFINEGSTVNAQAITFVNPGQARGRCSVVKTLSNIDTNLQGIPYLPCNAQQQEFTQTGVSLTAGANLVTVASTSGIKVGQIVSDVAVPTATWTAGSSTMVVSSGTGIVNGMKVTGPGILGGAIVTAGGGTTTITVGGCGGGPL